MDANLRKRIEERARANWEEAGRPEGADLLHWMQAERGLGIVGEVDDAAPAERVQFEDLQNAASEPAKDGLDDAPTGGAVTERS